MGEGNKTCDKRGYLWVNSDSELKCFVCIYKEVLIKRAWF